jgi:mRNA interferase HigB
MRLIKRYTVRQWAKRHADASEAIERWIEAVRDAEWTSLVELRRRFPSADLVSVASGGSVVVFNVRGNRYRLIAAVHFNRGIVYALRFLTHAEYGKDKWKDEL